MKKLPFTLQAIHLKHKIGLLLLLASGILAAQTGSQTIRGTVTDKQSEIPLIGAAVQLIGLENSKGAITDLNGRFEIANVPYGRQELTVSYLGYNTINIPNIVVSAGKEVVLEIHLEESVVQINEVVVTADVEKDKANNEMATVSARSFSVEEVNRYSGGRNDVSRLVSNFAGVSTANDSRNDIVIRGNSPLGVLWRLEGIPIPNPNHYSTLSTTGGPVSALNPNLLKNSDFMTSAFPAEYGNANAGVFDIGFRSGNKDRYEFTAQLAAFSGLEFMAEGPMSSKKNGSFLVSYRHSFVELAELVGIPVGTTTTPNYKDLSFKVDFGNGKAGNFSIFGIGGQSDITFLGEEIDENDLFANPNEDAAVDSKLGIIGLKHNYLLNNTTYIRTIVTASTSQNSYDQDNLQEDGTKLRVTEVNDINDRYSISSYLNKKFNAKFNLRTGVLVEYMNLKTRVDDRDGESDLDGDGVPDWVKVRDFSGGMTLFQAYGQGQYRFNEKWMLNLGLHGQYLDYNDTYAVEPRAAINWHFQSNQILNFGYGLHSQMQPLTVMFHEEETGPGVFEKTNAHLAFTQSHHFVLGYDLKFGTDWRIKAETYFQAIEKAPVESFSSSYSVLNSGADFVSPVEGSLVNEGVGTNYGVELTIEKFFSKGYYGLLTASLFESKYKGSDGIERNTAFNNNYVLNVLAGKEFKIGKDKHNALSFDFKLTTAGGRYYTPIDEEASKAAGEEVLIEELAFSEQYDPYFKLDIKFGYHLNSKKRRFSQQFFIDFQNVTDHENIFVLRYNELTNEINPVYQSGFFPDLLYRVQF